MAKLSKDNAAGTLHPRETLTASGSLGALNAEVQLACDGCSIVALDMRGTFSMTVQVQGSIDGTNWVLIPVRSQVGGIFVVGVVGAVPGIWMAACAGFAKVRAIVTAYTSGTAICTLAGSNAMFDDFAKNGAVTAQIGTATGASGAAVTLTLASPGAGLRYYITYLSVNRFAAAVLTASATPVLITTTNIPGSPVLTLPADAAALGSLFPWREDFAYPLACTAQGTATTIVCPATTGVIWRVTAGYYVAP